LSTLARALPLPCSWPSVARESMGAARAMAAALLGLLAPSVTGLAKLEDATALQQLYEATGGASWALQEGAPGDSMMLPGGNAYWDIAGSDPCPLNYTEAWNGVACVDPCYAPIDGDDCRFGRITGIQLPHNNLVGTVPPDVFGKLVNLTIFDVSHNQLSGTIPTQVGKLRNLMVFRVNNNLLSGTIPTEIQFIGSHVPPDENALLLEDLPADAQSRPTEYTYTPPSSLTSTMGLQQFDVSHNRLNGTIPTTIGALVNLQAVDVSNNPLFGMDGCCEGTDSYYKSFYDYNTTIPTQMGVLKKLQVLKMDFSGFQRHIPTEVGNMRSLQFWRVKGSDEHRVSGTIPSEFGRLKKLNEFMMEANALSGTLPSQIGGMDALERFQVQDNLLSGTLPDVFAGLQNLNEWDTFNNQLVGDIPSSIQLLGNLDYLYIQNEHSDVLRNYYCKQRIEASAIGRKHNHQVIAREYKNYKEVSACANPHDLAGAFDALSGDV